jgi:hypothetical protein
MAEQRAKSAVIRQKIEEHSNIAEIRERLLGRLEQQKTEA